MHHFKLITGLLFTKNRFFSSQVLIPTQTLQLLDPCWFVALALIFSFVGFLHPLSDLQLLEPVLVHLPFSQNKPNYSGWKTDHPVREDQISITDCTATVRVTHCVTDRKQGLKRTTRIRSLSSGFSLSS